jgi:F-type H+-transporting ATPase subunit c
MKEYFRFMAVFVVATLASPAYAFAEDGSGKSLIAIGAGLAIGVAAMGGALGQGKAVGSAVDSIGRNPSASGKVFVPMVLGLALIESLVILSFIIALMLTNRLG